MAVEYAKLARRHLFAIRVDNRGPAAAPLHVLPTLWLRNTWSWGGRRAVPAVVAMRRAGRHVAAAVETSQYGPQWLYADRAPELMFTENKTNVERLWGLPRKDQVFKDGINDCVVSGARTR